MRPTVLAACLAAMPLSAAAQGCFGTGLPLFHCESGGKAVDLCLQGDVVLYRFGPAQGAAELLLGRKVGEVHMRPWNGIGRHLWEEVTLFNGAYSYGINYSIDRLAEGEPQVAGGVTVRQGDKTLADLTCAAGSVTVHDFYPIFEAKEAAGQCWNRESFAWGAC